MMQRLILAGKRCLFIRCPELVCGGHQSLPRESPQANQRVQARCSEELVRSILTPAANDDDRQDQRGRRRKDRPCRNPGSSRSRQMVRLSANARQKGSRYVALAVPEGGAIERRGLLLSECGAAGSATIRNRRGRAHLPHSGPEHFPDRGRWRRLRINVSL